MFCHPAFLWRCYTFTAAEGNYALCSLQKASDVLWIMRVLSVCTCLWILPVDHLHQTVKRPVYFSSVLIFRPYLWESEVRIIVNILSKDFLLLFSNRMRLTRQNSLAYEKKKNIFRHELLQAPVNFNVRFSLDSQ
jgi:hypothetical protein